MPSRKKKKMAVWKNNPAGVGHPPLARVTIEPKRDCVTLNVSGFAIKKKTRAE
jgi:hypothetical protein